MKRLVYFLSFALALTLAHASDEGTDLMPLTEAEAKSIIEQRMANKALQEAARKAELEAVPAIERRVIEKNGRRVTMNRVAPPVLAAAPASVPDAPNASNPLTPAELAALMAAQPEHQSISLSVTVFGEGHSKVLWRQPRDNHETNQAPLEFELWTNINLNYLRPISSFDRDGVVYNYLGFTHTITHAGEAWRSAFAKERGHDYESRWEEPPVAFTAGVPEYVVVGNGSRPIPPELYQQMDALFAHYLDSSERYKADYLRSVALKKASEEYSKENPLEPSDVIINHWSVSKGGRR